MLLLMLLLLLLMLLLLLLVVDQSVILQPTDARAVANVESHHQRWMLCCSSRRTCPHIAPCSHPIRLPTREVLSLSCFAPRLLTFLTHPAAS